MIETYKIVTGKYDTVDSPKLEKVDSYITRGNDLRLHKRRSRYDLRKYCFTNKIVDVWNCLPTLLTILKLDLISIGTTKILFMISQHSCTELEVVVNR